MAREKGKGPTHTQANGAQEPKSLNEILSNLVVPVKVNRKEKKDNSSYYWAQRAKRLGLSDLQINLLQLKSDRALRDKVRELEKAQKALKTEKKPIEQNTLELSCLFSPEPTKATTKEIKLKNGNYMIIRTSPDVGLPTEFDLNVLLATFRLALKYNFEEFTTTYYQIAKAMNISPTSNTIYELIKQSIKRLTHATIETNNWWNPQDKNRQYIALFHFYQLFTYSDKTKKITIKFSKPVEDSIKAKYLKNIDYDKVFSLRGYAKILYLFLVKLTNQKDYLELTEETILRYLGKWEKYSQLPPWRRNFYIKRSIDPALEEAARAMGAKVEKTDKLYKINYCKSV